MATAQLWLFAGPNGAGKTTFTKSPAFSQYITHFLNADEVTRNLLVEKGYATYDSAPPEILQASNIIAAEKVFSEVKRLLDLGESVAVETVLSTDKYHSVVEKLQSAGGIFNLIYVGLRSPDLSKQRVATRVKKGGHPVPEEKLAARWQRSLKQLPWFASRADHFYIYDNSDSDPCREPILIAREGPTPGRLQLLDREANLELTKTLVTSKLFNPILPE